MNNIFIVLIPTLNITFIYTFERIVSKLDNKFLTYRNIFKLKTDIVKSTKLKLHPKDPPTEEIVEILQSIDLCNISQLF